MVMATHGIQTEYMEYKRTHTNTSTLLSNLRPLMPQQRRNITGAGYFFEIVLFCCVSQPSQRCHCSLPYPIPFSFTRRIVRQPYEAI